MALNSLISRVQAAGRRLSDLALWTHAGEDRELAGLFDPSRGSEIDSRARPLAPEFVILTADAPGIAEGDTLALEGITWEITGVWPDRTGETVLELREAMA